MLPSLIRRSRYTTPGILDDFFTGSFLPGYFSSDNTEARTSSPAVNVEETEKEYRIEVAAPGLNKDDLKVSVDDGILTISSEKKVENKEEKNNFIRREFGYTSFSRSFSLPEETDLDQVSAKHKNGILTISVPKAEVKIKAQKEIRIS
jgi:HSP20 family protein